MYLFRIRKNQDLNEDFPELNDIPAFKEVLKKSKGQDYIKILAFYCDWESPFRQFKNDEDRLSQITKTFFNKKTDSFYKTKTWKNAVQMYFFLQKDPDRMLYNSLQKYYEKIVTSIEELSGKKHDDLESELADMDKVYQFNKKAISLKSQIDELKDRIENSQTLINKKILDKLCYLEKRQYRLKVLNESL